MDGTGHVSEVLQPYEYLQRNYEERPDDIALIDGDTSQTWRSLYELTKRMARDLRDRGIQPGDVIGVRLPPMLSCLMNWAILHEAAVIIPFNPEMVDDERLNLRLVISNKPIANWPAEKNLVISNEWFEKIHVNSTIIEPRRYPEPDGLMRFGLTSGSTGRPKAMPIYWAVEAVRAAIAANTPFFRDSQMMLMGTRSDGGFRNFFGSAIAGRTYLVPHSGRQNAALLRKHKVQLLRASPVQLADLVKELERSSTSLPDLKLIMPTGAPLPPVLAARLRKRVDAEIGNSYACSEVGQISIRFHDSDDPFDAGEIAAGTTVEIVDEVTDQPVPDGEVGLVRAKRPTMVTSYLHSTDENTGGFRDGWFYTGDYAIVKDNRLFLRGRASEYINSGGLKTDPLRVEEAYAEFDGFEDCAAFGLPDSEGIPRIALAYVADREFAPAILRGIAREKLGIRTPLYFFRVDTIPRGDGMQKVQRARLAEQFAGRTNKPASFVSIDVNGATNSPAGFTQPFDYVQRAFDQSPDGAAVVNVNRTSTWKDLHHGAKRFALLLRERGVLPGDIVAVNLPSSLTVLVTLAVFHEAAVIAPFIKAMARPNKWGIKWLVTGELINAIPPHAQIVIDEALLREIWRMPIDIAPRMYPSADSLQRLAFSSGTTGTPKAIPFSVAQTELRSLDHESRTMSLVQPMCLMTPRLGMGWWPWYASVLTQRPYIKPSTPENNLRLLRRMRVDSVVGSPAQLSDIVTLLRQSKTSLPDIAVVQSGGSQLSRPLHDALKELTGATIMNAYGSTEVGPTTLRTDDENDPSYMGELLPGAQVEIVDPETDTTLPNGSTGLVRVRRHTMVDGYFHDEDATARAWHDGWFYSGDHGHLVGNRLYIEGRSEEIMNIGGAKVDPASIDSHFASYPEFTDHAAFGVVDNLGIERVALAYVSAEPLNDREIMARALPILRSRAPVVLWRMDRIPRNEMGKALRNELREKYRDTNNLGTTNKP